jgi:hypothetical protein
MMTVDRQPNELEPSARKILGAPRARKGGTLAAFVLLAIVGAAAVYGWLNFDGIACFFGGAAGNRSAGGR